MTPVFDIRRMEHVRLLVPQLDRDPRLQAGRMGKVIALTSQTGKGQPTQANYLVKWTGIGRPISVLRHEIERESKA